MYRVYAIYYNTARQKRQNDELRFDQLQHVVMLNHDKFGTELGIRDN